MKISRADSNTLTASIEVCIKQRHAALNGDLSAIAAYNRNVQTLNKLLGSTFLEMANEASADH